MAHKVEIQVLSGTLLDTANNNEVAEVRVMLADKLRQRFPIVSSGTAADEVNTYFKGFHLS